MSRGAVPTKELAEAHHNGMEDAYGNLTALLDRLHAADLHLIVWREGPRVFATVDGEGVPALEDEASESSARMSAQRMDELLGAVEEWCNDWLPTGHEVAL